MPSTVSLADVGQELKLSPAELSSIRSAGVRTVDGAHNLLAASLTGADAQLSTMDVARRRAVAEALTPWLSDNYKEAIVKNVGRGRGAAAPSAKALSNALLKASTQTQVTLQGLPERDLVKGRYAAWGIRDQGDRQTCVAFAVASCLELLRAGQGTTFTPLSPQFLYYYIRTKSSPPPELPPGWNDGATKLGYAQQILAKQGICRWEICPYATDLDPAHLEGPEPSVGARTEGEGNLVAHADYQPEQGPGTARRVYDHLAQGRPVAIAVPVFARADASSATNWSSGITSGEVLDPFSDRVFAGGHAVCVVGFQPDPAEANGGWFIFRNSVGGNWASGFQPTGDAPRVPARGFGAISATYIEVYCWEILSLMP